MKMIELCGKRGAGQFIKIDDVDFERVVAHRWNIYYAKTGPVYARTNIGGKVVFLHRFITGAAEGVHIDHENNDGLDNQRSNLRVATTSQNLANRRSWSKSGYKGVYWHQRSKRYRATINFEGKIRHLGSFADPLKAAIAYNQAAAESYGQFARLNQIQ